MWEVEFTDRFEKWWNELSEEEQEEIDARIEVLEHRGPASTTWRFRRPTISTTSICASCKRRS